MNQPYFRQFVVWVGCESPPSLTAGTMGGGVAATYVVLLHVPAVKLVKPWEEVFPQYAQTECTGESPPSLTAGPAGNC